MNPTAVRIALIWAVLVLAAGAARLLLPVAVDELAGITNVQIPGTKITPAFSLVTAARPYLLFAVHWVVPVVAAVIGIRSTVRVLALDSRRDR